MNEQDIQQLKEILLQSNNNLIKSFSHINPAEETKIFMELQKRENENIRCEINELKTIVATKQDVKLATEEALKSVLEKCDDRYPNKKEFGLVQKIVFIFVGILSLGALTTIGYFIKVSIGIK